MKPAPPPSSHLPIQKSELLTSKLVSDIHSLINAAKAGLAATVNSDDPAYFGGYINDNFTQTFAALGLGVREAYALARNSFEAGFIEEAARRHHIDALDEVFETFA